MKPKEPRECGQCRGKRWIQCPSCAHSCPCQVCGGTGMVVVVKVTFQNGTEGEITLPQNIAVIDFGE